ncbi:hypothetical protein SAMN05192558_1312 [Actinokineospora alba]|uniref:Uncharacterized protein n=1 Tax=Actinokineospora alba TaxID=504798 RepID=A0A1H0WPS8_9PSEU|nr:hypothetical protein SAMN05421871_101746 [Actinokineospora alba]SDP92663.1 hypothetical protein SAMN05192558_1312 [Actinokineospora alba]
MRYIFVDLMHMEVCRYRLLTVVAHYCESATAFGPQFDKVMRTARWVRKLDGLHFVSSKCAFHISRVPGANLCSIHQNGEWILRFTNMLREIVPAAVGEDAA